MGFWSSVGSAISSACSSIGSFPGQEKSEEDPTYKKYAAEMRNFKLEDNSVKTTSNVKNQDFQLNQMQDALDDIDSIDDVKKHFQGK